MLSGSFATILPWILANGYLMIFAADIIGGPIFISAAAKLNFKKFFYILFILSLPKALFFTILGYFFGRTYNSLINYFYYGQYLIIIVVISFIIVNYLFSRFLKKIFEGQIN